MMMMRVAVTLLMYVCFVVNQSTVVINPETSAVIREGRMLLAIG